MSLKYNSSIKENVFQKVDKLSLKDKVMDFTRVVLDRYEKFWCTELILLSSWLEVEIRIWISVTLLRCEYIYLWLMNKIRKWRCVWTKVSVVMVLIIVKQLTSRGDFMLQASHTPGPRATKALQDSTVHNIIVSSQEVSMNWRTAGQSHFQRRQLYWYTLNWLIGVF